MNIERTHIAAILRDAAQQVRQGWCRGLLCSFTAPRRVCALGGISFAATTSEEADAARAALQRAIGCDSVPAWNDDPMQTQANVAMALELAAILVEQDAVPDVTVLAAPAPAAQTAQ